MAPSFSRTSSTPAGAEAITPGSRQPGRVSISAFCCVLQSPRRAFRCYRWLRGSLPPRQSDLRAGLTVDLRWPNDLLLGERKTGGILVESKTDGSAVSFAVVGIGINVHQRAFDPDLATPATSLDLAAGRVISRQALLIALLKSLEHEAAQLPEQHAGKTIPERVAQASTWVRGRQVTIHGPQACTGVTAGLDEDGFLRVETPDGIVTVRTGGMRAVHEVIETG